MSAGAGGGSGKHAEYSRRTGHVNGVRVGWPSRGPGMGRLLTRGGQALVTRGGLTNGGKMR